MKHALVLAALLATTVSLAAQALPDATIFAPPSAGTQFGRDVDVDGDRMIVASVDRVHVLERQPDGSWAEVAHITAPNAATVYFGFAVALEGDRALISALFDGLSPDDDDGVCYVYERQRGGSWIPVAAFDDEVDGIVARFGWDVALDGERAVVSDDTVLEFVDSVTGFRRGAAYVYERQTDGTWTQVAKLYPTSGPIPTIAPHAFGHRVALDGDRLVVSCPSDSTFAEGAAFVFERQTDGTWVEVAKLEAEVEASNAFFGAAVAIAGDRVVASVDPPGTVGHPGFAHVFERQPSGAWTRVAKLEKPAPTPNDGFGRSVAVEGERIVVSAWACTGGAHVFDRAPDGSWRHTIEVAVNGADVVALEGGRAAVSAKPCSSPLVVHAFDAGALYHGAPTVSTNAGGAQSLYLRAGAEHSGELFLLLGSLSGTSPGVALDDVVLPLLPDAYTLFLLDGAGAGVVSPFAGVLDAQGAADAAFTLPAGSTPALAGLVLHHAFVAIDVAGSGNVELASNAARLELVP